MSQNKVNRISKNMIDPTFKEEIMQETSNQIGVLTGSVDAHKTAIASNAVLGHIKVGANLTITPDGTLNANASESYALTDGAVAKDYPIGHADTLVDIGFYKITGSDLTARGFPFNIGAEVGIVEVFSAIKNGAVVQRFSFNSANRPYLYVRSRSNNGVLWHPWHNIGSILNDTLTSTSTTEAATANAVRTVNNKLVADSVNIGLSASATNHSVAIGSASSATNFSVAIGRSASATNNFSGVLGVSTSVDGPRVWTVPGSFSVGGTKQFEMPHPHPDKKATHVIRHASVESPTSGDTLYRYTVDAIDDGETVELQLPDYFQHLNKDVDVWVNADKHFAHAFGDVVGDILRVTCEKTGAYKVLVIGTRNDDHQSVQNWDIKGVEREIGESWDGETYVFEDDEILTENEYLEAIV